MNTFLKGHLLVAGPIFDYNTDQTANCHSYCSSSWPPGLIFFEISVWVCFLATCISMALISPMASVAPSVLFKDSDPLICSVCKGWQSDCQSFSIHKTPWHILLFLITSFGEKRHHRASVPSLKFFSSSSISAMELNR